MVTKPDFYLYYFIRVNSRKFAAIDSCINNVLLKQEYAARFAGSVFFSFAFPQLALWARRISPASLADTFLPPPLCP